jgi:DsbC/DsbD-like thiol-disulfide interchange protein
MVMMRQPMACSFVSRHAAASRGAPVPVAFPALAGLFIAAALLFPCETRAQVAGTGARGPDDRLVAASLVSDARAIAPGQKFRLAVRLEPREGWHLNWLNPGDAGLAPGVGWKLPAGFVAGPPCWPLPERIRTGPLVIFGYSGELLLVFDVSTPASLAPGQTVELGADLSWLACADGCVPGSASVALSLPVRERMETDPAWLSRIEAALARCPRPSLEWNVEARADRQGMIVLDISAGDEQAKLRDVFFFPYDTGLIENAAPQRLSVIEGPYGRAAYQLTVEISRMAAAVPSRLSGILVSKSGWSGGDGAGAIEIDVPLGRQ